MSPLTDAERKAKQRKIAVEAGFCKDCMQRPATRGKRCEECAKIEIEAQRERRRLARLT
jgi:hypothetical protein